MILNAIVKGVKVVVDAIAKAVAWLLIALGLWVPLLYSLIFLIVVVAFTDVPLESTGTLYFLGLFLSFIGALWFSLVNSARKAKNRKRKKNTTNVSDVKKKKRDDEEQPEDPPEIKSDITYNLDDTQTDLNDIKMKDRNDTPQFNEPYGQDYGNTDNGSPRNWIEEQRQNGYVPSAPAFEPYGNPQGNVRSTYDQDKAKNWLSENPYNKPDRSAYPPQQDTNWLHQAEQRYEPRKGPTFEPYNTEPKNTEPRRKPTFEPYNTSLKPNDDVSLGQNDSFGGFSSRRRASFDSYNSEPKTQFEQNYDSEPPKKNWIQEERQKYEKALGSYDNVGQNDDLGRSARDRRRTSFEPYNSEPKTQFEQNYGSDIGGSPQQSNWLSRSDRSRRSFEPSAERTASPYEDGLGTRNSFGPTDSMPQQQYNAPNYGSPQQQYNAPNYGAPQQQYNAPNYGAPQQQYNAPNYGAPQQQYNAPNYGAPQQQYNAPNYGAPQQQYNAPNYGTPQQQYNAPNYGAPQQQYNAPNYNMPQNGYDSQPEPARATDEKPHIFRLREDPNMLVYEYSDRLDYYRRTPYGNEFVRTKRK